MPPKNKAKTATTSKCRRRSKRKISEEMPQDSKTQYLNEPNLYQSDEEDLDFKPSICTKRMPKQVSVKGRRRKHLTVDKSKKTESNLTENETCKEEVDNSDILEQDSRVVKSTVTSVKCTNNKQLESLKNSACLRKPNFDRFKFKKPKIDSSRSFETVSSNANTVCNDLKDGPEENCLDICMDTEPNCTLNDELIAKELQREENLNLKQTEQSVDIDVCQFCYKDLTHLNSLRKQQHINRCCDQYDKNMKEETDAVLKVQPTQFSCPICGKSSKSERGKRIHVKACAKKNNISTVQLIELLNSNESSTSNGSIKVDTTSKRKSQNEARNLRQRKTKKNLDEATQLALALSVSAATLQKDEKRRQNMAKKANVLTEVPKLIMMSDEERKTQIEEKVQVLTKGEDPEELFCTPALNPSKIATKYTLQNLRSNSKLGGLDTIEERSNQDAMATDNQSPTGQEQPTGSEEKFERDNTRELKTRLWDLTSIREPFLNSDNFYVAALLPVLQKDGLIRTAGATTMHMSEAKQPEAMDSIDQRSAPAITFVNENDIICSGSHREVSSDSQAHLAVILANLGSDGSDDEGKASAISGETSMAGSVNGEDIPSDGFMRICPSSQNQLELGKLKTDASHQLMQSFKSLSKFKELSDFQIRCRHGHVLHAHKLILVARCPVFQNMIMDAKCDFLNLEEYSQHAVEAVLRFFYSGDILFDSSVTDEVYQLAKRFDLDILKECCKLQMEDNRAQDMENKIEDPDLEVQEGTIARPYDRTSGVGATENSDDDTLLCGQQSKNVNDDWFNASVCVLLEQSLTQRQEESSEESVNAEDEASSPSVSGTAWDGEKEPSEKDSGVPNGAGDGNLVAEESCSPKAETYPGVENSVKDELLEHVGASFPINDRHIGGSILADQCPLRERVVLVEVAHPGISNDQEDVSESVSINESEHEAVHDCTSNYFEYKIYSTPCMSSVEKVPEKLSLTDGADYNSILEAEIDIAANKDETCTDKPMVPESMLKEGERSIVPISRSLSKDKTCFESEFDKKRNCNLGVQDEISNDGAVSVSLKDNEDATRNDGNLSCDSPPLFRDELSTSFRITNEDAMESSNDSLYMDTTEKLQFRLENPESNACDNTATPNYPLPTNSSPENCHSPVYSRKQDKKRKGKRQKEISGLKFREMLNSLSSVSSFSDVDSDGSCSEKISLEVETKLRFSEAANDSVRQCQNSSTSIVLSDCELDDQLDFFPSLNDNKLSNTDKTDTYEKSDFVTNVTGSSSQGGKNDISLSESICVDVEDMLTTYDESNCASAQNHVDDDRSNDNDRISLLGAASRFKMCASQKKQKHGTVNYVEDVISNNMPQPNVTRLNCLTDLSHDRSELHGTGAHDVPDLQVSLQRVMDAPASLRRNDLDRSIGDEIGDSYIPSCASQLVNFNCDVPTSEKEALQTRFKDKLFVKCSDEEGHNMCGEHSSDNDIEVNHTEAQGAVLGSSQLENHNGNCHSGNSGDVPILDDLRDSTAGASRCSTPFDVYEDDGGFNCDIVDLDIPFTPPKSRDNPKSVLNNTVFMGSSTRLRDCSPPQEICTRLNNGQPDSKSEVNLDYSLLNAKSSDAVNLSICIENNDSRNRKVFSTPKKSEVTTEGVPFGPGDCRHPDTGETITPMPDFAKMPTPELKAKAKQFALRQNLSKKVITSKLKEIYKYQHNFLNWESTPIQTSKRAPKKRKQLTEKFTKRNKTRWNGGEHIPVNDAHGREETMSNITVKEVNQEGEGAGNMDDSSSSSSSENDADEFDGCLGSDDDDVLPTQSQNDKESKESISEKLSRFFQENPDLLRDALRFKPINFDHLFSRVKASKIKCSKPKLLDFLDQQCISFSLSRTQKAFGRGRKKARHMKKN